MLKVNPMKDTKVSALTADHFEHLMEQASAGFELDCKQACRGLRVSMAVNVFGMGTLLPNNFADEDTSNPWDSHAQTSTVLPAMPLVAERAAAQSKSMDVAEYFHQ